MDNASAYGAEDCRFDPCLDRFFFGYSFAIVLTTSVEAALSDDG